MNWLKLEICRISGVHLWTMVAALALAALMMVAATRAQAQSFQVLYHFTGGRDGANPWDGLTIDRNGNLYGTASAGGNQGSGCQNDLETKGCGAAFELAHSKSGWSLVQLYDFKGGSDANPMLGMTIGPDGALYGSTFGAAQSCGNGYECGEVFRLAPPAPMTACGNGICKWHETVLHTFTDQPDASSPTSRVLFDSAGNIYGTTFFGGTYGDGAAYELSPRNGSWSESVIYSFYENGQFFGVAFPSGYLAIDQADNLYGAAYCNDTQGQGCFYGSVFQLQPSQSGWSLLPPLYQFNGFNGYAPISVMRDLSGNLFGVTTGAVGNDSGTIYEISPSNGDWTYSLVYDFGFETYASGLVMDSAGNLYGVNYSLFDDGYVFKLTPSGSGWSFTTLHTFDGSDGARPNGQLVLDSTGNLYGTTESGGRHGYGVIWEITP